MSEPHRVQLSRSKGWRMPPNTVKVDRSTRYGNPFRIGTVAIKNAAEAVRVFRLWIVEGIIVGPRPPDLTELRGKNLACWCKHGDPCHADVLIELANAAIAQPSNPNEDGL